MKKVIEIKELTKRYGKTTAVDHLSFTAEQGTMIGFLGVNGAGKSTTINMLSTILKPDSGEAFLNGYRIGTEDHHIRESIGVVYQQNVLDEMLTVKENILMRGRLQGLSGNRLKQRLTEVCTLLKLDEILSKRYRVLSGGQKRRCEIAAAIIHEPQILFLDEPTTGLDPATRIDVWEAVTSLRKHNGMTVFLTTHYMEEAATADRIVIIDRGRKLAEGTPYELKEHYAKDRLKLYFAAEREAAVLSALRPAVAKKQPYGLELELESSMEAIPVCERIQGMIEGFEVIQGNMDDVFLNVQKERGNE